ncbi:MAG TPA: aminotransferase class I/II-fold pyridoxal phosphate-dependent enzyme, partial [Clostridia bacterium]|nr:aminotransferase class I/II-fold pyridoxal phosphate-dependent enzyme [Clostridia bacterium]
MIKTLHDINRLIKNHEDYRKKSLNLIASENYSSNTVRSYLTSDLGNRYGCYATLEPEKREYRGNRYIHELEMEVQKLVGEVFKASYVDLRPIGGHIAGVAVVAGLLSPGDLVFEISLRDWGHGVVALMQEIPQFRQTIRVDYIPFTEDRMIDMEKLANMISELKPSMIILGGSGMLFPEPIKELRNVLDHKGAVLAHDVSHVSGLIAGGVYPNPLDEGADVIFGSTHKSFPGPQGGFVASRRRDIMTLVGDAMPALVTSHHLHRLPALAAAMLEMKAFGREYGEQVIKNSQALGQAMEKEGFKVVGSRKGYSFTHLILVDVSEFGRGSEMSTRLEEAGIFCSDDFGQSDKELRIGTAEVTRQGMKEAEMPIIAEFFRKVIVARENPARIAEQVAGLMCRFSSY